MLKKVLVLLLSIGMLYPSPMVATSAIAEEVTESEVEASAIEEEVTEFEVEASAIAADIDDKKNHILEETDDYIIYDDYSIEGKGGNTQALSDRKMIMLAHLSSISVSVNQSVSPGTKIGVMGDTGMAFGAHVHIELWNYYTTTVPACGNRINPNGYQSVFNGGYIQT